MFTALGTGVALLLLLSVLGVAAWIFMLAMPLKVAGIRIKDALNDITLPEAIIFGLYSIGAAVVVSGLFSNFSWGTIL